MVIKYLKLYQLRPNARQHCFFLFTTLTDNTHHPPSTTSPFPSFAPLLFPKPRNRHYPLITHPTPDHRPQSPQWTACVVRLCALFSGIALTAHFSADELLQLVFCELADPSSLTHVSQRFYRFSQDPYVRARYFLAHYGPVEAMYYALGRGKLMTERVIDVSLVHLPASCIPS